MFTNTHLNLLTQAASAGNVSIQLQTFNAGTNVTLSLIATGLAPGQSEDLMAANCLDQFATQLIQFAAVYAGPVLSDQFPAATFRIFRTDHVLTFFSETQFTLTVTDNTTGAEVIAAHEPILATVSGFEEFAGITGLGASLTTAQIILMLKIASGIITGELKNKIVICGYVRTTTGRWQTTFWLNQGLPTQSYDMPRIGMPGMLFNWWISLLPMLRWSLDPTIGKLFYKPNQNIVNFPEPGSLNNEIKISYSAGNWNIPPEVLLALTWIMKSMLEDRAGIKALKTGSFQVTYLDKGLIDKALDLLDAYQL